MSGTIHRVSVKVEDAQYITITGHPFSVAADRKGDHTRFDLWYEHMDHNAPFEAKILVLGTDHPVPWDQYTRHAYCFLGTVIYPEPNLVWHIWRGPNRGQAVGL